MNLMDSIAVSSALAAHPSIYLPNVATRSVHCTRPCFSSEIVVYKHYYRFKGSLTRCPSVDNACSVPHGCKLNSVTWAHF